MAVRRTIMGCDEYVAPSKPKIKLQKVQESAGSAVGDISIHKGDQAAIQGVTGQTKLIVYNVFDG